MGLAAVGIDHLFFFPPIPRKIGKMFRKISLVCVAVLVAQIYAQHKGTLTEERTLDLPYSTCTSSGCTEQKGGVTMDGNWRWTHKVGEPTNCYTGNEWDQELCADAASCTENCALDGIDDATWEGTYGYHRWWRHDFEICNPRTILQKCWIKNLPFGRIRTKVRQIHVVEPRIFLRC